MPAKVLALNDRTRFEHAGQQAGSSMNGYPFCRGRIFEVTEEDRGQYDDDREGVLEPPVPAC